MRKEDLIVKLSCAALLAILIVCGVFMSKNNNDVNEVPVEENVVMEVITPTPTPVPTNTPTPVPTVTPEPTSNVAEDDLTIFSTQEPEPSLYSTFTQEELELLFRVVEAEATDACVDCKSHVASVIFNRLKEGWWGGDLTRNLMAKNQFEVITNGRYMRVSITEDTITACEMAFKEDTAQGATFFDSTNGKSWAHKNRTWLFQDCAKHNFYY